MHSNTPHGNPPPDTVPFSAKLGWGIAWLLMLILLAMISRNCAGSIVYGTKTAQTQVEDAYRQGRTDGVAKHPAQVPINAQENPVLHKAYTKGYREGLDHSK